jgi:uncharacterized membrane protein YvbJ
MSDSWVPCPHCGEDIKEDANFCRHCGSSDDDGWGDDSEDYESDSLDDFDYDGFVEENYATTSGNLETKMHWRLVSVILLLIIGGIFGGMIFISWILS